MGRPKLDQPFVEQYWAQKQNARRRGIPFEFTYQEWIDWWGNDIIFRGKGKDKLVMARNNDCGAYHPDNVTKMLNQNNVSDGNRGKIVSVSTRDKLSQQKIGISRSLETKQKISETLKVYYKQKETI
jgi:hypothetical protein